MPTTTAPADILFQPWKINSLEVKNRIVLSPMAVLQPTEDGHVSDQSIAFMRVRAKGGVGLIIVGGSAATAKGVAEAPFHPLVQLDDDKFIPGLKRLTDAVHEEGVPIIAQIFPRFGRMGIPAPDREIIAASPRNVTMGAPHLPPGLIIPGGRTTPVPSEATIEDILETQEATVAAAKRAVAAGYDGVEVAAHMCYFYSSFLSPRSNWRTDAYGGSAENRARALTDVIRALRAELGADFPIGLRMNINDHLPDGQDPDGFAEVAAEIAKAGVGYIALADGSYEAMEFNLPSTSGTTLEHGEPQAFRAAVGPDVPLIISSTPDPQQAADAIAAGHADATQLARQLLADPQYANKVRDGRVADIVWCDHSNVCIRRLILNVPVTCDRNPETGREAGPGNYSKSTLRQRVFVALAGNRPLMGIVDKVASAKR